MFHLKIEIENELFNESINVVVAHSYHIKGLYFHRPHQAGEMCLPRL